MKFFQEWSEETILSMIKDKEKESLELEYKRCDALNSLNDKNKTEISKDISAFANSAGGVLIYGVEEDGHIPIRIDRGFDPNIISKERLENIINSNIHPRIDGLLIKQIELISTNPGHVLYVIIIPQATTRAPHQAADKRYYKRFNFKSVPMEDYEIRDILRRGSIPDLYFDFRFTGGKEANVEFSDEHEYSKEIDLIINVHNQSNEPALYAVLLIQLDSQVKINAPPDLKKTEESISIGKHIFHVTVLRQNWAIPIKLPIFNEISFTITDVPIKISLPAEHNGLDKNYEVSWRISAPGMVNLSVGQLVLSNNKLKIDIPNKISINELLSEITQNTLEKNNES